MVLSILFLFLSNPSYAQGPTHESGFIVLSDRLIYLREGLGTIVRITVGRGAKTGPVNRSDIKTMVDHEIDFAMQHLDRRKPDSEVSILGRSTGVQMVSHSLWKVLALAQSVCEATDGVFNVAYLTPGIGNGVTACFYYELGNKPWTVVIKKNTRLDLDGLAKGWVIKQVAHRLKGLGFKKFMVEIGGDIVVGKGISGPWRIGIQRPVKGRYEPDETMVMREENTSIFTSGTYERGPHIFDMKTGKYPLRKYSVTVRGPGPAIADALATAALISGPGAGYYKRFFGYAVVFTDSDGLLDAEGFGFDELDFP